MNKKLIAIGLAVLVVVGIIISVKMLMSNQKKTKGPAPVVIGLSQGSTVEERWKTDCDLFIRRAKELNADVKHVISNNDVEKQISQIEGLIKDGVKVIVVIPSDSDKLAPVIAKAREAGVKIIAYDRLIKNSDLDFYISFDNVAVGQMEAESVLSRVNKGKFAYIGGSPKDNNAFLVKDGSMAVMKSKIQSGDIKLVIDKYMNNWSPDEAYSTIKEYLAAGGELDAVVAANDGTASGVIKALEEKGLAGKIPVSGQDADLAACQRIAAGTQTATVYKPIKLIASKAAEMAFVLANGRKAETNSLVNNGKIDVPSYLIQPTIVDKDNMKDTIIKDNFHSYEDVYGKKAE
jgi:D-xylose transport system substrate-binding protein